MGRPRPAPVDPAAIGAGIVLATLVLLLLPGVWPVALVVGALPPLHARGRRARTAAAARAVLDELPEVIDLLGLAVGAGLTAPLAVAAVGRRGGGGLAAALGEATVAAARDGRRLPDVLDDVPARLGAAVRAPGRCLASASPRSPERSPGRGCRPPALQIGLASCVLAKERTRTDRYIV